MAHFNRYRKSHRNIIAGAVVMAILICASMVYSFTYCRYSIIFMGKTTGSDCTLAYMEVGAGSCESFQSYYLQLNSAGPPVVEISHEEYRHVLPLWKKEFIQGDTLEFIEQFDELDGQFFIGRDRKLTVDPPAYDSTFPSRPGEFWEYPLTPEEGRLDERVDSPLINRPVKFVYRHDGGVYKNYRITEVYKTGDYLFIKTQSLLEGLNRNYPGVLVYQIINQ